MAGRLLDAAKAATQLAAWSDLGDNILDDGSSVESEDSEGDLMLAGDNDDETNDNINDPSLENSPGARTSAEDEMSDGSEEESDSDDSTEGSYTLTQSTFREKMVGFGLPHVLNHQERVHVISDTPEKDQSEMQKTSKMK